VLEPAYAKERLPVPIGRLHFLALMCFVACVMLVVMHYIKWRFVINHSDVNDVLPKILNKLLFWSGYCPVITFFAISGFLITGLSIRRWETMGHSNER
jgi:peptidoglycan/LPS O-acetylase OafA/YrhL